MVTSNSTSVKPRAEEAEDAARMVLSPLPAKAKRRQRQCAPLVQHSRHETVALTR